MSDGVDKFENFPTPDGVLAFAAQILGMVHLTELLDALLGGRIIDCDGLNDAREGVGLADATDAVRDGADQAGEQIAPDLTDILKDPNQSNIKAVLSKLHREGRLDLAALDPADHDLLDYLYRLRGKPAREYLRERRLEHLFDGQSR